MADQKTPEELKDDDLDQVQGGSNQTESTTSQDKSLLDYDWIAHNSKTGTSKEPGKTGKLGVVEGYDNTKL